MIGTIVGVKTSGERVFVIRQLDENLWRGPVPLYLVRRPLVGKEGLRHENTQFYEDELETVEENLTRELDEMVLKARLTEKILGAYRRELEAKQASKEPKEYRN